MTKQQESVTRPTAPPVRAEFIPVELKDLPRWVCWRYARDEWKGKWNKQPVSCRTKRNADITNLKVMGTFEEAMAFYENSQGKMDGVGFALFENDPVSGIDLDGCRAGDSGVLQPQADEIVRQVNTYTEVSPSGCGIRLFVRGKLASGSKTRRAGIEVYSRERYLTVTGMHLPGTPLTVEDRQEKLVWLHDQFLVKPDEAGTPSTVAWEAEPTDEQVIARARKARNGDKFIRLFEQGRSSSYRSPSEADLALCGMLVYWLGTYATPERVERLFGQSALGTSEKWLARQDYREMTIKQATRGCRDYRPREGMLIRIKQDYSRAVNTGGGSTGDDMAPLSPEVEELAVRAAEEMAQSHHSLPDWQSMFALARRLRKISDGRLSEPSFRRAVEAFCDRTGFPVEEYWMAFLDCWHKTLLAEGEDPLDWAVKMSAQNPIKTDPCYVDMRGRVASVAWYLARLTRTKPFLLPVPRLGDLLGVSAMTAWRAIDQLERVGVVKCVNPNWSFTKHRAKEYIFTGSLADEAA